MSNLTNTSENRRFALPKIKGNAIVIGLYLLFLLLPIYWQFSFAFFLIAQISDVFLFAILGSIWDSIWHALWIVWEP